MFLLPPFKIHAHFTSFMATFLKILFLLSVVWLSTSFTESKQVPKHYVVYMGSSADGSHEDAQVSKLAHLQILSSVIPSHEKERRSLIHHYHHAMKGFSAMLTEEEAYFLSGRDDVVSIFPDPILSLQTTRSWDFLNEQSGRKPRLHKNNYHLSSDVIIGVIDTGIWPESPSFDDTGFGEIPSKWKGVCMEAQDFKKSNCNKKLIGARYYYVDGEASNDASPRDLAGHGTHTASTAAGTPVANASYYGIAQGTAKGGLPSARIAAYKVCLVRSCSGAAILKAIDDAIEDGVDVISLSIGASSEVDYLKDPLALGAFHAAQHGVIVTCAAGNDGPRPSTVINEAPWIFTVAASNIDREFRSTVVLGNGKELHGTAISISNLTRLKKYPLAFGEDVTAGATPVSNARSCYPGMLDPAKVAGKIVVCEKIGASITTISNILMNVEGANAKGLILIQAKEKRQPLDAGTFPFTEVDNAVEQQLSKYINSTKYPMATILPTTDVPRYRPAPEVAYFSSRGPGQLTQNILKPDIMAPGLGIIAAIVPKKEPGRVPANFGIYSGTSMACPHVAGAAALIKSVHPQWTSSMVKSALMTTATITNNEGKSLTNSSGNYANPHQVGAGEISPSKALDPGLIFESTIEDQILFLCHFGYPEKTVRSLVHRNCSCPKHTSKALISNVNYPSISISQLPRDKTAQIITRTVTNVGLPNAKYTVKVDPPMGLVVKVSPEKLWFTPKIMKASFNVSFSGKDAPGGYNFGSITWSDGKHSVRSVFAVNVL